jgi:hypothetical protein
MNTASQLEPHTHTSRGTCLGPEFTATADALQGDSAELLPSLLVVGIGPVVAHAHVLIHACSRAKELDDRPLRSLAPVTPGMFYQRASLCVTST